MGYYHIRMGAPCVTGASPHPLPMLHTGRLSQVLPAGRYGAALLWGSKYWHVAYQSQTPRQWPPTANATIAQAPELLWACIAASRHLKRQHGIFLFRKKQHDGLARVPGCLLRPATRAEPPLHAATACRSSAPTQHRQAPAAPNPLRAPQLSSCACLTPPGRTISPAGLL